MTGPDVVPRLDDLLDDFATMSTRFNVLDRSGELAKIMAFEPNLGKPLHRWFNFKEGFSSELVGKLVADFPPKKKRRFKFLDPFCGVGTSLLAAPGALKELGIKNVTVHGVEINPYMHFVTRTKLNWRTYDPMFLLRAGAISTNGLKLRRKPIVPGLSTLNDSRFVAKDDLIRILELRDKVKQVAHGRTEVNPLMLGIAAGAERVLNLRKDGRALRYVLREAEVDVDTEINAAWNQIAEDLQTKQPDARSGWKVMRGDGRRADKIFKGEKFDMIFFSPPYLNNIDYTEVYKIEQWLLEFLQSSDDMVAQRKKTFRSHPSCTFPVRRDQDDQRVSEILGERFQRLLDYASAGKKWRARLFLGYFSDMLRTLESCKRLLNADGRIFLVIGNSIHGTTDRPIPVATDLWIAALAEHLGLVVEAVVVGRSLPRGRMKWDGFRESILVISKKRANGKKN